MDLKDIKAIIDLMKKNSVSEFELERQDFKIRLKRAANGTPQVQTDEATALTYVPQPVVLAQNTTGNLTSASAPATNVAASSELEIKSPMIGTFYRAPSPESGNYVEVGT